MNELANPMNELVKAAEELILKKSYFESANIYETLIKDYPQIKLLYWRLGLVLLLQGKEIEAHLIWISGMVDGDVAEVDEWTQDLVQNLADQADKSIQEDELNTSWLIRRHIVELIPYDTENNLHLIILSCELQYNIEEIINELNFIALLKEVDIKTLEPDLLLLAVSQVLKFYPMGDTLEDLVKICLERKLHFLSENTFLECCLHRIQFFADYGSAIAIAELYLEFNPNSLEFLGNLSSWYCELFEFEKSLLLIDRRLELSSEWICKIYSSQLKLKALMGAGGYWAEALTAFENHFSILAAFGKSEPRPVQLIDIFRLITSTFFLPYFEDNAVINRMIHNEVASIFQGSLASQKPQEIKGPKELLLTRYKGQEKNRKLRIGYISSCFRNHSVGWLARWLIQHHCRDRFEIYGYVIDLREYDELQQWYIQHFDKVCQVGVDCQDTGADVARKIYTDEVDILIDLDSITFDLTCQVMAYKPAPIQATWLGWDASGIPSIDYYIADCYSLPEKAQEYYSEKIWSLPKSYIAVDGFDVGIPNISRQELNIPDNAIVYMSAQSGYKRHRDTVFLQMKIISSVPNSYLLIKGPSDDVAIQRYFEEIAIEVGVELSQLRFLPRTSTGAIHRANLRIADVCLDTFPYNGATTTLETLWMEVPLVTLVGKQFAARNSYTMLKNAGVEEGIAWTAAEYILWGIRLGTDLALRQSVVWKLRQSKVNAPIWNAKAFTKEMEHAYLAMWEIYQMNVN